MRNSEVGTRNRHVSLVSLFRVPRSAFHVLIALLLFPTTRFTILLVPPVTDPALQTYDGWERLVIVHELTHVFLLDRSRGLWKTLQSVFGRVPGLFPNQYQPTWVTEGLATYYESRFTTGGRADGSFHREVVGADAAFGRARSPWDALLFTRWPDGLAPS